MQEIVGREAVYVAADIGEAGAEIAVGGSLNAVIESDPDGNADEGKGEGENRCIGGREPKRME